MGFDGGGSSANLIVFNLTASATKPFKNLVIGLCSLSSCSDVTSGGGAIFGSGGQFRGCIYSNIIADCNLPVQLLGNDIASEWTSGNFPLNYGTADQLFFEGNTVKWTHAAGGFSDPGWFLTQQCMRAVIRYNTWAYSNGVTGGLLVDNHGAQYFPGGQCGDMCVEFYGNTVTGWNGYEIMDYRGGWLLMFNNIVTGSGAAGSDTVPWQYPNGCLADTGAPSEEITNTYFWNNSLGGSVVNATLDPTYEYCSLAEDRNFRNYNASFDGTVGIDRGGRTFGSCVGR